MSNKEYKISKESVDRVFSETNIDILGYEPPVQLIMGEMIRKIEDNIVRVVREYDIDVDKEELIKALQYDRNQYEKGYINGYNRKSSDVAEEIFTEIEKYFMYDGKYIGHISQSKFVELKKKYTEEGK